MRPTGNKILVLQDTETIENVTEVNGFIAGGAILDKITKEIQDNKDFSYNGKDLKDFGNQFLETTAKKGVTVKKYLTGQIKFIGRKVDKDEMDVGDKVQFNQYVVTPEAEVEYEGVTYLLMKDDAVLLNLSKD